MFRVVNYNRNYSEAETVELESKIRLPNCDNHHVFNCMVSVVCYNPSIFFFSNMRVTLVHMDLWIHMHKNVNTVHAMGGSSQHAT